MIIYARSRGLGRAVGAHCLRREAHERLGAPEAVVGGGAPERAADARGSADVARRAEGEDVGEWPWAEIG
jgi:hypothetical protein